jgi:hydroxycarboxylate dehydrogenase B
MAGVGNAVLFALFDPAHFGGADCFLTATTGLTEFVRGCPPAAGVGCITLPGDPERQTRARRQAEGVTVPDGTWALLVTEAGQLGVTVPA